MYNIHIFTGLEHINENINILPYEKIRSENKPLARRNLKENDCQHTIQVILVIGPLMLVVMFKRAIRKSKKDLLSILEAEEVAVGR